MMNLISPHLVVQLTNPQHPAASPSRCRPRGFRHVKSIFSFLNIMKETGTQRTNFTPPQCTESKVQVTTTVFIQGSKTHDWIRFSTFHWYRDERHNSSTTETVTDTLLYNVILLYFTCCACVSVFHAQTFALLDSLTECLAHCEHCAFVFWFLLEASYFTFHIQLDLICPWW